MKKYALAVLVFTGLFAIFVKTLNALDEPYPMDWFIMTANSYSCDGLTFDFFVYEDMSDYVGTINFRWDGENWYVDEFVDIMQPHRLPSLEAFAESLLRYLNEDFGLYEAFGPLFPQSFDSGWNTNAFTLLEYKTTIDHCRQSDLIFLPLLLSN